MIGVYAAHPMWVRVVGKFCNVRRRGRGVEGVMSRTGKTFGILQIHISRPTVSAGTVTDRSTYSAYPTTQSLPFWLKRMWVVDVLAPGFVSWISRLAVPAAAGRKNMR